MVHVAARYRRLAHRPRDVGGVLEDTVLAGLPVGMPLKVAQAATLVLDEPLTASRAAGLVRLRARLARHLRVDRDRLVLGVGAPALLRDLLTVVCDPDTPGGAGTNEIVITDPCPDWYWRAIGSVCATPVLVPSAPGRDLAAVAAAIDRDRCRAVLVPTVDFPTGAVLDGAALEDFLDRVPAHVLVVLDDTHRDYALYPPVNPDIPDGLRLEAGHPEREGARPNLVVLRDWTSHGLAELPIGYLAADLTLAAAVAATGTAAPGRVAQAAAAATLEEQVQDQYREIWAALARERTRMSHDLRLLGFDVPPSGGNYLWIPLGEQAERLTQHFVQHLHAGSAPGTSTATSSVRVRGYTGQGVLVTVGLPEHNNRVLAAAATYRPPRNAPDTGAHVGSGVDVEVWITGSRT